MHKDMKILMEMTKEEIGALTPEEVAAIVAESNAESDRLHQEVLDFLYNNGEIIDLGKWVTLKEYKERFGLKSINIITNWIRRGVIPAENVRTIEALNGIRLVKAVPYKKSDIDRG